MLNLHISSQDSGNNRPVSILSNSSTDSRKNVCMFNLNHSLLNKKFCKNNNQGVGALSRQTHVWSCLACRRSLTMLSFVANYIWVGLFQSYLCQPDSRRQHRQNHVRSKHSHHWCATGEHIRASPVFFCFFCYVNDISFSIIICWWQLDFILPQRFKRYLRHKVQLLNRVLHC